MAKALKSGDAVTVAKKYFFKHDSDEFNRGLKSLKPGDVGRVIDAAQGRSVRVEFKGQEAIIASQRLSRLEETTAKRGRPRKAVQGPKLGGTGELENSRFITNVANRLLQSGSASNIEPDTRIEIQMDDLPKALQAQIQKLVQAKLALGPQSSGAARRGRPASPAAEAVVSAKRDGEAPRRRGRPKGRSKKATAESSETMEA